MMTIEHESACYAWSYDSLYGVGNFIRKRDGAVSFLETGEDCTELRRRLNRLRSKTGSHRYPRFAPSFEDCLDNIARDHEFHGDNSEFDSAEYDHQFRR
jgi:hypothetical protein